MMKNTKIILMITMLMVFSSVVFGATTVGYDYVSVNTLQSDTLTDINISSDLIPSSSQNIGSSINPFTEFFGNLNWNFLTNLPTNLDVDSTNDLTTSTSFGGVISGLWNSFTLNNDVINDNQINYTNVTLSDFTNDAGYLVTETNETVRVNNLVKDDCLSTEKVIGVYNNGTVLCASDNTLANYWINNSNNLTYTNGNIGIGTTTPTTKLHVKEVSTAQATIESSTASAVLNLQGNNILNVAGDIRMKQFSTIIAQIQGFVMSNAPYKGELRFATNNGVGIYPFEKMVIKSDGKVGIGTNSPLKTLQVAGSTLIDKNLTVINHINSQTQKINSTTATTPPLTIVPTNTPLLNKENGSMFINKNGTLFIYDSSRIKWLSVETSSYSFGRNGARQGQYLRSADIRNGLSGQMMPINATITRISSMCAPASLDPNHPFSIHVNGLPVLTYNNVLNKYTNNNVNINLLAGDYISVFSELGVNTADDCITTLWIKWRE